MALLKAPTPAEPQHQGLAAKQPIACYCKPVELLLRVWGGWGRVKLDRGRWEGASGGGWDWQWPLQPHPQPMSGLDARHGAALDSASKIASGGLNIPIAETGTFPEQLLPPRRLPELLPPAHSSSHFCTSASLGAGQFRIGLLENAKIVKAQFFDNWHCTARQGLKSPNGPKNIWPPRKLPRHTYRQFAAHLCAMAQWSLVQTTSSIWNYLSAEFLTFWGRWFLLSMSFSFCMNSILIYVNLFIS